MNTANKQFLGLMALSLMAITSCKSDLDTTPPQINAVRVNGVQADEHELNAGTSFGVQVIFSDNEALNQAKVSLHAADDGHGHDGESGEETSPNIGTWSDTRIINLEGTEAAENLTFPVPGDIAGYWHLEVLLIDEDGNEAEEYIATLHVSNDDLPVIVLTTSPEAVDGVVTIAAGGTLSLGGTISDADGVGLIHVELENQSGTVVWSEEVDAALATSYSIDPALVVPVVTTGEFHLHVHASDANGLENAWEVEVVVE